MKTKWIPTLTILLSLAAGALRAQEPAAAPTPTASSENAARARRLIELSGVDQLAPRIRDSVIDEMKSKRKDVPGELFEKFRAQVDPNELTERLVIAYASLFTTEELDALIALYATPVGQSIVKKQGSVAQETMANSGNWGGLLGERLVALVTAYKEQEAAGQRVKAEAERKDTAPPPPHR
ncbi:MAG TPA: DUF2059 domain-containing protein [Thermoanaerobaculia bacterium]|nr:DUF2059 domain-containing protein [Thermoanaerobaculia bacterium]